MPLNVVSSLLLPSACLAVVLAAFPTFHFAHNFSMQIESLISQVVCPVYD